jgi:predicted CXXCH cytochrome family protein
MCIVTAASLRAETPIELASIDTARLDLPRPSGSSGSSLTTSRSCTSCHVVDSTLSHPVEVRATMRVPDALPLAAGRITCTTCHLDDNQQHTTGGSFNALLRTDRRGAAFCANCHTTGSSVGTSHAGRLNRAHLAWPGRTAGFNIASSPFASASTSRGGGVLDEVSRQCMDCHDGSRGTDIGRSHPMGVVYDASSFTDSRTSAARRLVPLNQLDPRIKLINNTIGCSSCHDIYSRQHNMLVMTNTRDQLCTSCHAMR